MKIDFGRLSQTVANIGVIASVVFLALQVRQSQHAIDEQNMLTRLTVRDTQYENNSRLRYLILANPDLQEIAIKARTGQQLTAFEKARFRTLCAEQLFMGLTSFARAEALGFPDGLRAGVGAAVRGVRESKEFEECWKDVSELFRSDGTTLL